MQKLLIVFFVLATFQRVAKACPKRWSGKFGDDKRRKRSTIDEIQETDFLRTYLIVCTDKLYKGPAYDWESNVNFAVLHSVWYKNTEDVYCSPSGNGPTVECWQDELDKVLSDQANDLVKTTLKTCIDHYGVDRSADPPADRYTEGVLTRRKRQVATETDLSYAGCVTSSEDDPASSVIMDFEALSRFIEDQVSDPCNSNTRTDQSTEDQNLDWSNRFIALTRSDSTLRTSLRECAVEYFPPPDYWATWGPWSECSTSCQGENQFRQRECLSGPIPHTPVNTCEGRSTQKRTCDTCGMSPYIWSQWSPYSRCTQSCGGGYLVKSRKCLMDQNSGQTTSCQGPSEFKVSCNIHECLTVVDQRCPPFLNFGCYQPEECPTHCQSNQICCPTSCGSACADVPPGVKVFPEFNTFF